MGYDEFVSRRSYRQYCGLAVALDVVAQRWALLIVRDLAPGPRRFTDLFGALPGISTDMLAQRLRELEEAGALQRVELADPAPATLYQLTERGRGLARITGELAQWGMPLLAEVDAGELRTNARWFLQTIAARYQGGLPDADIHLTIRPDDGGGSPGRADRMGEALTLSLRGRRARLRYGHQADEPSASLACTTEALFRLRRDPDALTDGVPDELDASGDLGLLVDLFRLLPPIDDGEQAIS